MTGARWLLICVVLAGAGACTAANEDFVPWGRDAGGERPVVGRDTPGSSPDVGGPNPGADTGAPETADAGPAEVAPADVPPADSASEAQADMSSPDASVDPPPDAPVDLPPDAPADLPADLPPPVAGGPALHWRFDETGSGALDSSGNGWSGLYTGTTSVPTTSAQTPPTRFPNPSSRLFATAGRNAVFMPNPPARLKPANNFTLSIWFRASTLPSGGADLINMGTDYLLRVKPTAIEFAKRVSNTPGMLYALMTLWTANHVDGKWHHLAAVTSPAGMVVYLDGMIVDSNNRGQDVIYQGAELWVGRDGADSSRDFGGALDDVRIYGSALGPAEVSALAQGQP